MLKSKRLLWCLVVCGAATMAGAAHAQDPGLITCWYDEKNAYTGADTAQPGARLGLERTEPRGPYSWAYTIRAADGTSCPRTRPQS